MLNKDLKTVNQDIAKIIECIALICKIISKKVEKSQSKNLHDKINSINYHGDIVKKLDIVANDIFLNNLVSISDIKEIISEEMHLPYLVNSEGKYIISVDPLDGSSNIEACVSIGSIFGIYNTNNEILVSGYCIYSSSTIFVLNVNQVVNSYILDKDIGEFIKHKKDIKIPKYNKIYSVNHGLYNNLSDTNKTIIDNCVNKGYSMRYIGSMVADVHRTLLYGGIFMYPNTNNLPNGKLRFYYEVLPLSHIICCAGGQAYINKDTLVLDYKTDDIHQCVPVYLGSLQVLREIMNL
ncbi:fructose-1,6-bisphosphatase [Hokovirus HKV1]|uniref:fructose-bisphosphatase n=1 Tax=Hokovirus HKV1 TaxID=1977638 RepID=A0A1V0SEY8_9VIRU|nr:fructose-1,6-bisphosphatase [Hokovirus HKV1]